MSEEIEMQQETIAQKLKGAFNKAGAEFKCMFSVPVGCEELEYAVIPSTMKIDVSLSLEKREREVRKQMS